MLFIDKNGITDAERIVVKIFSAIERGEMNKVNGIIVHQTSASTASSTFNSYQNKDAKGAHFLIDKDGTIYQTASLYKLTWHVGLIQSRCVLTKKCEPTELKKMMDLDASWKNHRKVSKTEYKKSFPDRFPNNADSIGIEIVGLAKEVKGQKEAVYESVNDKQNESLKWLISELTDTLKVPMNEIYRHPYIGRKTESEASTAEW